MSFRTFGAGTGAAALREVEIKKDPRSIPTANRPKDQGGKEAGGTQRVRLSRIRSAFADSAQDFSSLGDQKKDRTGNESDQKAETTRLKLMVEVGDLPPNVLNRIAALFLFVFHMGSGRRGYGGAGGGALIW
jgi:hypothetical protein